MRQLLIKLAKRSKSLKCRLTFKHYYQRIITSANKPKLSLSNNISRLH